MITLQSAETLQQASTERKMWLQPVWIVLVALLCDKVHGGPAEPSAGKFRRKISVYIYERKLANTLQMDAPMETYGQ